MRQADRAKSSGNQVDPIVGEKPVSPRVDLHPLDPFLMADLLHTALAEVSRAEMPRLEGNGQPGQEDDAGGDGSQVDDALQW